jgi:hypothetical protein
MEWQFIRRNSNSMLSAVRGHCCNTEITADLLPVYDISLGSLDMLKCVNASSMGSLLSASMSLLIAASLHLNSFIAVLIFLIHSTNDCWLNPDFTSPYCAKFDKRNPIKSLTPDSRCRFQIKRKGSSWNSHWMQSSPSRVTIL